MKLYGAERPLELLSYIMHRCKSHRTTSGEFWEEEEHDELRTPGWTEMLFSFHVIFISHFYQRTVTDNGPSGSSDGVKLCYTLRTSGLARKSNSFELQQLDEVFIESRLCRNRWKHFYSSIYLLVLQ